MIGVGKWTDMTPALIATRAPTISLLFSFAFHTILHGSKARIISIVAE
jgi:hypothetical protein